jgi:acetyl-CoA C-acetyltransferase
MPEALIIDACRTPRGIGKVGKGALADEHPQHLASTVLKAIAERNGLNTAEVDDIIWGTSSQRGKQSNDMGRMAALDAGYDVKASGVTLDRFCGSGITAVNLAAAQVMSGMEDLVIAGGTEMMSYTSSSASQNAAFFDGPPLMDAGNTHLRKLHPRSRTRASAPTPSRRWRASAARRWTSSPTSASSAPPRRSTRAGSTAAWCRSTTRTGR